MHLQPNADGKNAAPFCSICGYHSIRLLATGSFTRNVSKQHSGFQIIASELGMHQTAIFKI